jgi:UDP-N-acetyl-D-mannosaminuronic acid dehydrogenase
VTVTPAPLIDDNSDESSTIVIIGGCGHVGLPLGVALATRGHCVRLLDLGAAPVAMVNAGTLPFTDEGLDSALRQALAAGTIRATTDPTILASAATVIVAVGTPAYNGVEPELDTVPRVLREYRSYLSGDQVVIIRSTLSIGGTGRVEQTLAELGLDCPVAFCPERSVEGRAYAEIFTLPQIVAARKPSALARCQDLFGSVAASLIVVEPESAEFAKLLCNAWRYVKFAAANQFWMIASQLGIDYQEVYSAVTEGYTRGADLPTPGFAAGPCLPKDTRLLSASIPGGFDLGQNALRINEGLAQVIVDRLSSFGDLESKTIGILGMSFKGDCDDDRDSTAYALWRILTDRGLRVLCSDENLQSPQFVEAGALLETADIVVIGAPHSAYKTIETRAAIVDLWGITGRITTI